MPLIVPGLRLLLRHRARAPDQYRIRQLSYSHLPPPLQIARTVYIRSIMIVVAHAVMRRLSAPPQTAPARPVPSHRPSSAMTILQLVTAAARRCIESMLESPDWHSMTARCAVTWPCNSPRSSPSSPGAVIKAPIACTPPLKLSGYETSEFHMPHASPGRVMIR